VEAQRVNLVINQGAKFDQTILVRDRTTGDVRDLTGHTARMQARLNRSDASELFDLTSGDGLTLGGIDGTIRIVIPATDTAGYTWDQGVYDLKIIPASGPDDAERVLQGYVVVNKGVTE
jgi:hypothetical protein